MAHEIIRNFNKKGIKKLCIKVDLQRVYDKLNREFIFHMLVRMYFPP